MADTPAPIDPDRVLEQQFTTVRRGLDPLEVQRFLLHLANDLRAGREREAELAHQLEDSEKRTAPIDDLDPGQLARLLGEETARVLEAAQSAASEIRGKAEENVARLLREARDESQQMRDDADTVLSRKSEEAESVAASIRADAEADLEKARSEAAELVEAGRHEGREMVGEAQKVRQRMLDDLSRRRKLLRQQIEQLQAGRDRLLSAYDVVRETLDVATEELHIALPEAKLAAETTALKASEDESDDVAEETGVPDAAADVAAAVDVTAADPSATDAAVDEEPAEAESVDEPAGTETDADAEAESDSDSDSDDVKSADDEAVDVAAGEPSDTAEPKPADSTETTTTDEVDASDVALGVDEPQADEGDEAVDALAPDPVEGRHSTSVKVVRSRGGDKAADVFARLRQQEPEPTAGSADDQSADAAVDPASADIDSAAEVAPAPPETDAAEEDVEPEEPLDPAAELVIRRDAATTPLEKNLARRLKRELSDEQNEVLATLSSAKGSPKADDLLPAPEDHVARYQSLSVPTLAAAATAGADLVSTIAGPAAAHTSVADLAAELAAELVAPLRERLDRAFGVGDDPDDIAQSIRSSYREWKGQRVDQIAAHAVVAASNRGLIDRLPEGTLVRWVLADGDIASPDCEDNALAGAIVRGEQFPTGHIAPPLSATCRCVVVPVELGKS